MVRRSTCFLRRGAVGPVLLLAAFACVATKQPAGQRFAAASDAEAWSLLPREPRPLPRWALTTIESLPLATALQVDLNALHRNQNPLGRVLSARLRWAVADANRCEYAKESAAADLARAGLDAEERLHLGDRELADEAERAAVAFARKLTLSASAIRDEEVAALVERFGLDDVVAIAHTVAYANFQDRLFLAFGLTSEPGGAMPPLQLRAPPDAVLAVPARQAPSESITTREAGREAGAEPQVAWSSRSFEELQDLLAQQKSRAPRVPEPDATRLARFPRPDRDRIARSMWGRVSRGYQPALAGGWSEAMRVFTREAGLDEVFANTMFWVVTRTNDCFY